MQQLQTVWKVVFMCFNLQYHKRCRCCTHIAQVVSSWTKADRPGQLPKPLYYLACSASIHIWCSFCKHFVSTRFVPGYEIGMTMPIMYSTRRYGVPSPTAEGDLTRLPSFLYSREMNPSCEPSYDDPFHLPSTGARSLGRGSAHNFSCTLCKMKIKLLIFLFSAALHPSSPSFGSDQSNSSKKALRSSVGSAAPPTDAQWNWFVLCAMHDVKCAS
jgi:hypothetical protein